MENQADRERGYSLRSYCAFLLPLIASRILSYFYVLGDQAIVGRTSLAGYAAVSVAANFVYLITGSLGMLGPAFDILGSRDRENAPFLQAMFGTGLSLSLALGVVFELFCLLFGRTLLGGPFHLDGEALSLAYSYLVIVGLTLGLNSIVFLAAAYLRIHRETPVILWCTLVSDLVNLAVDYLLVFGKFGFPRLGVQGAAIGTLVGAIYACVHYLLHLVKHQRLQLRLQLDRQIMSQLLRCYFPLLGQDLMEYTLFLTLLLALVSRLGNLTLSSYNLLTNLYQLVTLIILSCGTTAMNFVATAVGAHDRGQLQRIPWRLAGLAAALSLPLVGFIAWRSRWLLGLITDDSRLIAAAAGSAVAFGCYVLLGIPAQIGRSALNAAGNERLVLVITVGSSLAALVVIALVLPEFGFGAVLAGLILNQVCSGLLFWAAYQRAVRRLNERSEEAGNQSAAGSYQQPGA